jgi:hypothetical protein
MYVLTKHQGLNTNKMEEQIELYLGEISQGETTHATSIHNFTFRTMNTV